MTRRALVFVLGLTVGDYLVWNWSLNGSHDVIALISGLTLPPLALVSVWMLAVALARTVGGLARRRRGAVRAAPVRSRGYRAQRSSEPAAGQRAAQGEAAPASRKLAA